MPVITVRIKYHKVSM